MEWIFLIMLLGAATYAGVEYMKHFYPSWYEKQENRWYSDIHTRLKTIEKQLGIGGDK